MTDCASQCSASLSSARRDRLLRSKSRRSLVPQNSQRSLVSQKSLQDLSLSCHSLLNDDDDFRNTSSINSDELRLEFEIPDTADLMSLSFSSIPRRDLPRGESFRREMPPRGESFRRSIPRGESLRSRSSSCRSFNTSFSERGHISKSLSGDGSSLGGTVPPHMPHRSKRNLIDVPLMVISSDEFSEEDGSSSEESK